LAKIVKNLIIIWESEKAICLQKMRFLQGLLRLEAISGIWLILDTPKIIEI